MALWSNINIWPSCRPGGVEANTLLYATHWNHTYLSLNNSLLSFFFNFFQIHSYCLFLERILDIYTAPYSICIKFFIKVIIRKDRVMCYTTAFERLSKKMLSFLDTASDFFLIFSVETESDFIQSNQNTSKCWEIGLK